MSSKEKDNRNLKKGRFEIRTSQEETEMLEYCSKETGMTKTEVIRLGIKKVYQEIKNKK